MARSGVRRSRSTVSSEVVSPRSGRRAFDWKPPRFVLCFVARKKAVAPFCGMFCSPRAADTVQETREC
eukprot:scaffold187852_cov24-Tisochrysis_lutea.AAC.1